MAATTEVDVAGEDTGHNDDHHNDDHHDDHHDDHSSGAAPAAALPRGRSLQVGGAFFTAATLMYFGSLFAIYLSERADHLADNLAIGGGDPWIPATADVQLTAPTIMAWTLLISIVPMQWAVWSFKRNDRRHGLIALLLQAVFAGAIINQTVFQWNQLGLVADDTSSNAAVLIYAITGSFVAAMVVALIAMALAAFRALSGASTAQHTDGVATVAVYWYALVAVYFVIWILIFITK